MSTRTRNPDLVWSFRRNPRLLRQVEASESPGYIKYLGDLIAGLKHAGCRNILAKVAEAGNLNHLQSIISELKIASRLVSSRKRIILLSGSGSTIPTPDMLTHNSRDSYVEVKRLSEDAVRHELVRNLVTSCNQLGLAARIDVKLGQRLSVPAISFAQRTKKERVAGSCSRSFIRQMRDVRQHNLPIRIETRWARIDVSPSSLGRNHMGSLRTDVISVPVKRYKRKIKFDVLLKAKKRERWTGRRRSKFYIVAIDCEDISIEVDEFEDVLLGSRMSIFGGPIPRVRLPRRVQKAIQLGWKGFLLSNCIIPNRQKNAYLDFDKISNRGLYLRDRLLDNVSAVICRFASGQTRIIPNPYAEKRINDPNLAQFL